MKVHVQSRKVFRSVLSLLLCTLMSQLPSVATAAGMISTSTVVAELSRVRDEQSVTNYLNREDVKKVLANKGLSPGQITQRMAGLSDHEVRQLANQVTSAKYGGDILGLVLIILLIVFLIERV